jgi:hypothetical protein
MPNILADFPADIQADARAIRAEDLYANLIVFIAYGLARNPKPNESFAYILHGTSLPEDIPEDIKHKVKLCRAVFLLMTEPEQSVFKSHFASVLPQIAGKRSRKARTKAKKQTRRLRRRRM